MNGQWVLSRFCWQVLQESNGKYQEVCSERVSYCAPKLWEILVMNFLLLSLENRCVQNSLDLYVGRQRGS